MLELNNPSSHADMFVDSAPTAESFAGVSKVWLCMQPCGWIIERKVTKTPKTSPNARCQILSDNEVCPSPARHGHVAVREQVSGGKLFHFKAPQPTPALVGEACVRTAHVAR